MKFLTLRTLVLSILLISGLSYALAQNNSLNFFPGDYVSVSNPADFNVGASTDFSIEAVIKTTFNGSQRRCIFSKMVDNFDPNQAITGYQLWAWDGNLQLEWFENGNGPFTISGTTNISDAQCHHVAVVVDRSAQNAKLYVDGVLEADVTDTRYGLDIDNIAPVYIGRDRTAGGAFYWYGDLDEVAFFKRVRTNSEIAQSALSEISATEADLTGYWKFNSGVDGADNTGVTTATDETGGNDGTLINFDLTGTQVVTNAPDGVPGSPPVVAGTWKTTPCGLLPAPPPGGGQNNALNFLQGDYIAVDNPDDFEVGANTDFTIQAVVKTTFNANNQRRCIFSKMVDNFDPNQAITGYQLWAWDGKLALEWYENGNGPFFIASTTDITDAQCHHVAVVVDRNAQNAKLYVDGVLEADVTDTRYGLDIDNIAPVYIGRDRTGSGGFYWYGDMDEVAFFNSARTASEISQSSTNALSGTESGLIGYWKLDSGVDGADNTGIITAIDETGGNNGTLINFDLTGTEVVTNAPDGVPGSPPVVTGTWKTSPCGLLPPSPPQENVLNFAADDYILVNNPTDFEVGTSTDFTIEAIVKTTFNGPTQRRCIFSKMVDNFDPNQAITGYQLWAWDGKLALEWFENGNGPFYISSNTTISDGECHHVAVVVDRSAQNAKLYVDGVLETDVTDTRYGIDIDNIAPVYIGRDRTAGGAFYWYGDLDEVAFFAATRTTAEIAQSVTTPLTGSETGLIGYWKFDSGVDGADNTGVTTAIDETGGNNGTLINFDLTGTQVVTNAPDGVPGSPPVVVGTWKSNTCSLSAPPPPAPTESVQSGAWDDPNTWGPGGVPTPDTDVMIGNGNTVTLPVAATQVAKSVCVMPSSALVVPATAALTITGSHPIPNSATGETAALLSEGITNVGGTLNIAPDPAGPLPTKGLVSNGVMAIAENAEVNIDNVTDVALETGPNSETDNEGDINIGLQSTSEFEQAMDTKGNFRHKKGSLTISKKAKKGVKYTKQFDNSSRMVFVPNTPPQTLLAALQYQLIFVNTMSTSNTIFSFELGATIEGSGTIGSVGFVSNGGELIAGNSPGIIGFDAAVDLSPSPFIMEVDAPVEPALDYDQISVAGDLTLGSTLDVAINYAPTNGDVVTLVEATSITGQFSAITSAVPLAPEWELKYNFPNTGQVSLAYIVDADDDGIPDDQDNCPAIANANQLDTDGDLDGDACDDDDDNDGVLDVNDLDPLDAFVCADSDGDGCDDCSSGTNDPNNDGADNDSDGVCDAGDPDDDNDGIADVNDLDPFDPFVCADSDGDTCDDCASGTNDPNNDGTDTDADGLCDTGDLDDDEDGILDADEIACGSDPLDAGSTCEVCDGQDNDGDGQTDEDAGCTGPTYCTSAGQNSSSEWIDRVRVGGLLDNTSGNDGGYGDYTGTVIDLGIGTSEYFQLTPGFSNGYYKEKWRVWIDYNHDGDFDDAGERIFQRGGTGTVKGWITIPTTVTPGPTRMRVSMRFKKNPQPCQTLPYGEVEDYTVNLVNPACDPLPANWYSQDIGYANYTGSACYDANTGEYTISSSGADIYGAVDKFHFAYTELCGDGEIIAKVNDIKATGSYALAGVMFRKNLNKKSKYAGMLKRPNGKVLFQSRYQYAGFTGSGQSSGAVPGWIRVTRIGNTFTGYKSTDGANWTPTYTSTVSMPSCVKVGLAVSSYNTQLVNASLFDNVQVNSLANARLANNDLSIEEIREMLNPNGARPADGSTQEEDAQLTIDEELEGVAVAVFPNPASNWINVRFDDPGNREDASYQLYDTHGRVIQTGTLDVSLIDQIRIEELPEGVYMIRITHQEIVSEHTIVKME